MLTIALTGGIGSGKTAVTDIFRQLGSRLGLQESLEIIDADIIARDLLAGSLNESSSCALKEVYHHFGADLFDSNLQLDRAKLRALVFASETKKKQLEAILHPLVYKEIFSQITRFGQTEAFSEKEAFSHREAISEKKGFKQKGSSSPNKQRTGIVIIAIPLLFETHYEDRFDRVLVIDVPVELQIERSIQRDSCARELIEQIINSQVDRLTRLNRADNVIDNSGTLAMLHEQVEKLLHYYYSLEGCSLN